MKQTMKNTRMLIRVAHGGGIIEELFIRSAANVCIQHI